MSFKYKELFVLFAIFEAINGLALDNSPSRKSQSKDQSPVYSVTEKFQNSSADNPSAESVTVLILNSSNNLSNSLESPDNSVTAAITANTTIKSTSAPPTTVTTLATQPVSEQWQTDKWVISNSTTKNICIVAEMAMQLNITYLGKDQKLRNTTVNIPENTTYSGSCEDNSQYLNISWGPGYLLLINFGINKTAKTYFISGISLDVNSTVLKDGPGVEMLHFTNDSKEFVTPLNMSYRCNKIQDINLEEKQGNGSATLHLKNTHFEAYMNKRKPEFSAAQDCDVFDTPDIVPIAVGCALAILVLVVLVAYLIARKRSHSQGYLSM